MSFSSRQEVKSTRKPCRCYYCGEVIPVGSSKIVLSGVVEGDFNSDSFHPECEKALWAWMKEEYGVPSGEFPEPHSMKRGTTEER